MCCRLILSSWVIGAMAVGATAEDRLRPAIERALPLLERASAGSADQRDCFTCHSQGLPIIALSEARLRGFVVDDANLQRQLEHTHAHLERNRDRFLEGTGTGGKADTAGYALWALSAGDRGPDATTEAVAEFLLSWHDTADHWSPTSHRPPSEASPFTTTYAALRGLEAFGTAAQQERIAARTQSARQWLITATPQDNEDRVFRLWGLQRAGADADLVASAATDLLALQRGDGGWSQIDGQESDAYATATALVALHRTDALPTENDPFQRGVVFLLDSQLDDGSWHVASRSEPFQTYYESGFPHGADQFISTTASGWAVLALLAGSPDTIRDPALKLPHAP